VWLDGFAFDAWTSAFEAAEALPSRELSIERHKTMFQEHYRLQFLAKYTSLKCGRKDSDQPVRACCAVAAMLEGSFKRGSSQPYVSGHRINRLGFASSTMSRYLSEAFQLLAKQ
jgi:hypothetical protein